MDAGTSVSFGQRALLSGAEFGIGLRQHESAFHFPHQFKPSLNDRIGLDHGWNQLKDDFSAIGLDTTHLDSLWNDYRMHERGHVPNASSRGDTITVSKLLGRYDNSLQVLRDHIARQAFQYERSASRFKKSMVSMMVLVGVLLLLLVAGVRNSDVLRRKLKDDHVNLNRSIRQVSDYQYALDQAAIVAITDRTGKIQYVNDYFVSISKYSREELIGNDHRIVNSGYHPKEYFQDLWRTIAQGKTWKGELRNRAKDGTIYWLYTCIVPFLDEMGKPYQYLAIRFDITEKKKTEEVRAANVALQEEVQAKKLELADVLERITEGFIVLDRDFHYLYANSKVGEMVRMDPKEMIGKSVWGLFPEAVGSATYHAMHKALRTQQYIEHLDYFEPLDLWQENRIHPSEKGLSVFIRDVTLEKRTERRLNESEKLYRTIASNIPDSVICLLDTDFRYFLIEGDLIKRLGYNREAILGKRAIDVLLPERYAELLGYFERAMAGETITSELSRGSIDLLNRFVPLRNQQNQIYAIMTVSIDITHLKETERKVIEVNASLETRIAERTKLLELTNKELESFSYSVAHDLRAPVRAMSGYAGMLLEDYHEKLDAEGQRYLAEIQNNATKMDNLIEDLLAFSRLGRKGMRVQSCPLNEIVGDVLKDLFKGHATIEVGPLPTVVADTSLVKVALTNLLSNAVKYSAKRKNPEISVTGSSTGGWSTIVIKDNGAGFNMKYADKLFGVFQRMHAANEFDGNGVGLAIVQRIVFRHGGRIWAEAEEDKGATFYFTLPTETLDSSII